ncbi:hypothetical protein YC2023_106136 [Brassica napus]
MGLLPNRFSVTGEFAPVAIIGGFVALAVAMAGHSLKQQLMHAPGVSTRKNRRAAVAEVDDPDNCVSSADKYINKSWLRKVGQIQDKSSAILSDPTRPNPFTTKSQSNGPDSVFDSLDSIKFQVGEIYDAIVAVCNAQYVEPRVAEFLGSFHRFS